MKVALSERYLIWTILNLLLLAAAIIINPTLGLGFLYGYGLMMLVTWLVLKLPRERRVRIVKRFLFYERIFFTVAAVFIDMYFPQDMLLVIGSFISMILFLPYTYTLCTRVGEECGSARRASVRVRRISS